MKLQPVHTAHVIPTAPFHFDATFHKPDHFTSGDNAWQPGARWQTMRWQGTPLGLKISNAGSVDAPDVLIEVWAETCPDDALLTLILDELRYRFNLDLNLAPFCAAFEHDLVLGQILRRWRGMRPGHPSSLYEYLIIGIVLQNATVRRSIQMFGALLEHYGTLLEYDDRSLWCFWSPGELSPVTEADLRGLKVGYRAKSIKRIDDAFAAGEINEQALRTLDLPAQRSALLKLYGVGPATVWYLLFDVFHHADFFDHISPWEQKIYSKLFFDRDPEDPVPVEQLLRHFERYGAYRQMAVHYLWEDLWWKRKHEHIEWLEKLIRV